MSSMSNSRASVRVPIDTLRLPKAAVLHTRGSRLKRPRNSWRNSTSFLPFTLPRTVKSFAGRKSGSPLKPVAQPKSMR